MQGSGKDLTCAVYTPTLVSLVTVSWPSLYTGAHVPGVKNMARLCPECLYVCTFLWSSVPFVDLHLSWFWSPELNNSATYRIIRVNSGNQRINSYAGTRQSGHAPQGWGRNQAPWPGQEWTLQWLGSGKGRSPKERSRDLGEVSGSTEERGWGRGCLLICMKVFSILIWWGCPGVYQRKGNHHPQPPISPSVRVLTRGQKPPRFCL